MATNPISGPAAHVTLPGAFPPMPAVARILSRFDRDQLAGFIAVAIDLADAMEGDADLELNGDEADGLLAEDDFCPHNVPIHLQGPGCPIADPDQAVDDLGCDDINDDREPEYDLIPSYGIDQASLPLPINYAGERAAMRQHLNRVRAERCDKLRWGGFRLREPDDLHV